MSDVRGGVGVRLAAAHAVLRVGRVLERRPREAGIVDPEAERAAPSVREIGDERIVGVDDEGRGGGEARDRGAPALGDVLELAVAVELVAKEVAERDDARLHAPHHLRQRELVDLEQAEVGVGSGEQGGGDARGEVGAGVVPGEPVAAAEDPRQHRARRRLAVRRRDDGDAGGQACRERVEGARIDLPEQLPGQRRATAAPDGAGEPPDEAGGRGLGVEAHSHRPEPTPASPNGPARPFWPHLHISQNALQ